MSIFIDSYSKGCQYEDSDVENLCEYCVYDAFSTSQQRENYDGATILPQSPNSNTTTESIRDILDSALKLSGVANYLEGPSSGYSDRWSSERTYELHGTNVSIHSNISILHRRDAITTFKISAELHKNNCIRQNRFSIDRPRDCDWSNWLQADATDFDTCGNKSTCSLQQLRKLSYNLFFVN